MGFGIGTALKIGSDLYSAHKGKKDAKRQGKAAKKSAIEQQAFNNIAAQATRASGQHAALEEIRQAEIISSRAVAVAAAGGYSEDIDHLLADIEGEGVYRASLAMFEAETEAERLRFSGQQGVDEASSFASDLRSRSKRVALGSIFSAGATFFDSRDNFGKIKSDD